MPYLQIADSIFAVANPIPIIEAIHERKMKAGIAISPDTPSTAITDEVGALVDMILVMTVHPGASRLRLSPQPITGTHSL